MKMGVRCPIAALFGHMQGRCLVCMIEPGTQIATGANERRTNPDSIYASNASWL